MFLNADIVVKVVMVGLLFASLVTWTVWLAKNIELCGEAARPRGACASCNEARSLAEAQPARSASSNETRRAAGAHRGARGAGVAASRPEA